MTKHLTVILGMHRSGTSLLSAGLSYAGAKFGNELMGGSEFNLKGHWEDNDIVAFNNRVLSALNITWDSTKFIDDNASHHNEIKSLVDEGVLLIEQKLTINDKRFAFKDPRTIRVLPIWLSIFKKLNILFFRQSFRSNKKNFSDTRSDITFYFFHLNFSQGRIEEVSYVIIRTITSNGIYLIFHQGN